jgi:hypothetical protein
VNDKTGDVRWKDNHLIVACSALFRENGIEALANGAEAAEWVDDAG